MITMSKHASVLGSGSDFWSDRHFGSFVRICLDWRDLSYVFLQQHLTQINPAQCDGMQYADTNEYSLEYGGNQVLPKAAMTAL